MLDCLIVGGGIIGLSIGRELLRRGLQIKLLDEPQAPQIASWAAAGILPPPIQRAAHDPLEQIRELSHERFPEWCAQLTAESGIEVEFERHGGVYLARRVGEKVSLQVAMEQWGRDGVVAERLSDESLRELAPTLAPLPHGADAYFLPEEAQVRPPRIVEALQAILDQTGARKTTKLDCLEINEVLDGLELATAIGPIQARTICVAAGPWTPQLLESLGVRIPIEPRRGQIAMWRLPQRPFKPVINEGPRYLVTRDDGYVLAGSTVEDVGYDGEVTEPGIRSLIQFATGLLPPLDGQPPIKTWAGLRPMSIDGVPYLSSLPGNERVFVASGHFRSGIHLAPATAEVMADRIVGNTPAISLTPFELQR